MNKFKQNKTKKCRSTMTKTWEYAWGHLLLSRMAFHFMNENFGHDSIVYATFSSTQPNSSLFPIQMRSYRNGHFFDFPNKYSHTPIYVINYRRYSLCVALWKMKMKRKKKKMSSGILASFNAWRINELRIYWPESRSIAINIWRSTHSKWMKTIV